VGLVAWIAPEPGDLRGADRLAQRSRSRCERAPNTIICRQH